MINQTTIARPYARAAFNLAQETNQHNDWMEYLLTLSNIVTDQKITLFLKNPIIPTNQKISLLLNCCTKYTNSTFINFLKVLSLKNRILFLPAIYKLFKNYVYEKENAIDITVTTAFLLKENEQKGLLYLLTEKFNKKVFVNFYVNSTILGGILIKAGTNVFDNTIKETIFSFRNHLLKF